LRPSEVKAYAFPGGAVFSDRPDLLDPADIIRALHRHPEVRDELIAATTFSSHHGRPRMEGSWALIMFAFLLSKVVEYKSFLDVNRSSAIWELAGFPRTPRKSLVWLRLTELEDHAEAFEVAAQKLIARAKRHNDLIGRHVHLDGTAFTTYAKGIHECPDAAVCASQRTTARGETRLVPGELARGSAQDADAARHATSAMPEDEVSDDQVEAYGIEWLDTETDPQLELIPLQRRRRYRWFKQGGHIYRIADTSTGARSLDRVGRNKFHFGGQLMVVSDDLFHAPLAIYSQAADVQEAAHYEAIYAKTAAAVGDPYTVTFDRGLHLKRIFEHNLRHRVSTVCEWRQPQSGLWPENYECAEFDRHGVARCRHCGDSCHIDGAGLGLFLDQNDNPYLRVRCQGAHTPDCNKPQQVRCSLEPRLLQPITRRDRLFWDLQQAHKNKEGLFAHFRSRYRVAGRTLGDCVKRRQCVPAQRLRAAAGMFLDWFRICLKHGYLSRPRRGADPSEPPAKSLKRRSGWGHVKDVWAQREEHGLDLPYGPAALRAGLAPDGTVPSQRAGP